MGEVVKGETRMKCKHCNGTGKVRGYFYEKTGVNKWEKVWGDSPCEECNGTGEIEVTNEEWLRQCTTEQLAEILFQEYCNGRNDATTGDWEGVDTYIRWLKQPHT